MTIPLKFLLFIVVAVILLFAFWLAYHETRTPQNQTEVMNRAIELQKEGRYDKKPANRDESIRRAEESLQKGLTFFDGQSQDDLSLEPFEIGGAYELLGDISEKDKCPLYEKAHGLFVRQLPLIKGDSYTAYGHTTPLEPVRRDVRKHLNATTEKSSRVGCTIPSEK